MCGIAGVVSKEPLQPNQVEQVARMSQAIIHRGPDQAGEFVGPNIALAVRRLSIIDIANGWQPLYNEDRSIVVVANGEIYNFVELRAQLQAKGHTFATGSDCEVIPHLYEEYGAACVEHLRGMFAFALWDSHRRQLVLARDRMGEKPLYLHESEDHIYFGSEIKALLQGGIVPFELDPYAVDCYFHYQYVPEPMTPIKEVRKLPPATVLIVGTTPWHVEQRCYWRMEDAAPLEGHPAELIRSELETIAELTIRSDVPVGIALSGGLDSSAIAALVSKRYPGTMQAFSVGYPGRPFYDERDDAKTLARSLRMSLHEIEVTTDDVVEGFPQLIFRQDDPIADLSANGYYAVSKAARSHNVPVMMQGHGADELFWGYPWVTKALNQSKRKARLAQSSGSHVTEYLQLKLLPDAWSRRGIWDWGRSIAGLRSSWQEYQRDRTAPPERLVLFDLTPDFEMAETALDSIYTQQFQESLGEATAYDLFSSFIPSPHLDVEFTRLISQTYLLENGIAQGDRLSMASSVELRLPFVDYRLVETVIGLRKTQSDSHLEPKAWLKAALKDVLPDSVLNRPKQGFRPPVKAWHRALFARYGSLLEDGFLVRSGVLTPASARDLARGPFPLGAIVPLSYKALVLEMWCRRFNSSLE